MKIIVTGGSGCVGSALKSISMNDSDWIFIDGKDCDLRDRDQTIKLFQEIGPDYIIHLAGVVPGFYNIDIVTSYSDNVTINENVLEASHLVGINRGIFCLSVNMFSALNKYPMDESVMFANELTGIFTGYGQSKRMLALQCQNYNVQYNSKYFGIIPCNIYGPNDNWISGRLIPNLIIKFLEAKKNNSDVIINGTGKPLRQFIYSIDLANIIKSLVFSYSDTKHIICSGDEEISIFDLANLIGKIINFSNEIKFDTTKLDGSLKKTVSNNYLKTIIPDIKFTSLEEGLRSTIQHMSNK